MTNKLNGFLNIAVFVVIALNVGCNGKENLKARFLKNLKPCTIDSNIVLVDIGHLNRHAIFKMADVVNGFDPKVMAMYVHFDGERPEDSLIQDISTGLKKMVVFSYPVFKNKEIIKVEKSRFSQFPQGTIVFSSFESKHKMPFGFSLSRKDVNGNDYGSFVLEVLKLYDTELYEKFKNQGRMMLDYHCDESHFTMLQPEHVLAKDTSKLTLVKNKLVLFGYFIDRPADDVSKSGSGGKADFVKYGNPNELKTVYASTVVANAFKTIFDRDKEQ